MDNTQDFINRYKNDGIIWHFDIVEQSAENFYCTLLQMKSAGWFQYTKGIIVGRVFAPKSYYPDFTYQKAFKKVFPTLPIIFNADIGHVAPKMTIINGSITQITCQNGKGVIKQNI